jgi:NADH-quinone oxidoreductase subunit M
MLQQLFFGELPARRAGFADLNAVEAAILAALSVPIVAIGVYPRPLLDLIGAGSAAVLGTG